MPLRNLAWLLIVPGIVGLSLAVSFSAPPPDRDYDRVRQIVNVLAEVDANFYRELTEEEKQQLVEDMINGGLRKLDPHSEYLNAEQLKRFETDAQGSFGGVGIVLAIDQPAPVVQAAIGIAQGVGGSPLGLFLKVDHPMPGTPAYEAGIVADDLIVKVGDKSTAGITVPDARKMIVGEPGTKVTLTIRRAGRAQDEEVALTRARIAQHPVSGVRRRADDPSKWEWFIDKPAGIGYIRLSGFNELTTKELEAAVKEIEADGGKALILDLRENPGGLLTEAVSVADLFLADGKIVSTRDRRSKERTFDAKKDGTVFLPAEQKHLVVLVNDGSASASEIVAAALQDHKRAVVIGERTYGKGSVQKLLRLGGEGDHKAAVKLTTETYWRPSGANIDRIRASKDAPNDWGVKPDIEVPTTKEDRFRADVEQLKLQWVAGKPDVVKARPAPTPRGSDGKPLVDESKPYVDQPLKKAIEVLKGKLGGVGVVFPPARRVPQPVAG